MKWFLAGLGIGSAIGMLIAPKPGADTRDELLQSAQDQFNQARERIQPLVDEARQRIEPLVQQAREKAEPVISDARERLQPVVDDAREKLNSVADQGREAANSAAERVSDLKDRVSSAGTGSSLLEIINEWPHERLIEIDGIGPVLATKIIQNRPYESEQQLIEYKELPPSAIENLRNAA